MPSMGGGGVDETCLEALRSGRSVAVEGPPGIGKSTAIVKIIDAWRAAGGTVNEGAASQSARRVPLAGLAGLLSRNTTTVSVGRERPLLLALREARPGTADALDRLVASPHTLRITVPPLSTAGARELLEARLGGPMDHTSIEKLLEASEGNPLLLHELTVAGLEAGTIRQVQGVWRCRIIVARTSVREVYRERVAAWPPDLRQVVSAVAVAEAVPEELLCACFGEVAVREAQLLDAIRPDRRATSLVLRHALLREAVLAGLAGTEATALLSRLLEGADTVAGRGVSALQRGLWLLTLGDDMRADPDVVIRGADLALDSLQTALAVRLAELALRLRPTASFPRELIARVAASSGGPPASDEDASVLVAALKGRFEWFCFGAVPVDELRAELTRTYGLVHEPVHVLQTSIVAASLEWVTGQQAELALDQLAELALRAVHEPEISVIATMFAASAALHCGQLERSVELVNDAPIGANPFHQAQRGLTTSQGLLRLGRYDEALESAEELRKLADETNMAAQLFTLVVSGQLQLQRGDAHGAVRTMGSLVAELDELDAGGIASWASAWLAATLAWTGQAASTEPLSVPPYALYLEPEIRLAEAVALAESGRLREARELALALADGAATRGGRVIAMWAAHLALRIQPTRAGALHVERLARRVDGEVAAAVVEHAMAVADDDGPKLEKVADRFVEVGFLSLAHEAYLVASRAYRSVGARTASARAAASAARLESGGCVPSFAVRDAPAAPVGLTLREREVALAVAEGLSHRAVADALGISARTAETHLHRAYRKLGVTNADELRTVLGR